MVQLHKYDKVELDTILKSMVILYDSNEKENSHILEYLDKKKVKYKKMKLNFGDYSFYLPANEKLGITRDLYFTDVVTVERKGSLEEVSGNFTNGRANIEEEFTRKRGIMHFMIENASYEDIVNHNYNTKYEPLSFIATLNSFEARYNLKTSFVKRQAAGNFIYHKFYYYLREYFTRGLAL